MNPDPTPNHPQGSSRTGGCGKSCFGICAIGGLLLVTVLIIFVFSSTPPTGDESGKGNHDLTVIGGYGSGHYAVGDRIPIVALPSPDQIFQNWTTDKAGSFGDSEKIKTTFIMPGNTVTVVANYEPVDLYFAGQFMSKRKRAKYEIDSEKRRFSFYTLIQGRFLLQTEISPYQVRQVEGTGFVIEISGADNRAGGGPSTSVRLEKVSESSFRLDRIKPVGGDLGLFHVLPLP